VCALTSRSHRYYSDLAGPANAEKYQTGIYLAGSASAEFIADVALCPFEAVKVRPARTGQLWWLSVVPPALPARRQPPS